MQFVLDCSVAISWCLVDENNDYANSILAMMVDSEAFVPGIFNINMNAHPINSNLLFPTNI